MDAFRLCGKFRMALWVFFIFTVFSRWSALQAAGSGSPRVAFRLAPEPFVFGAPLLAPLTFFFFVAYGTSPGWQAL